MKNRFFLCLALAGLFPLFLPAQTSLQKSSPAFSLLNLVHSPDPILLKIGPQPAGYDPFSFGLCAEMLSWPPNVSLLIEAPGFSPLKIPPTAASPGECVLFIVQDGLEKSSGEGESKPVLKYLTVASTKDRPPYFVDGINLTSRPTLTCTIGEKKISLERGKRMRLSTADHMNLQVNDGPMVAISPSELPFSLLVVFYENLEEKMEFAIINDGRISP